MAKSVFYSFHYQRDYWRVQQIMNMGALEGQTILNPQDWEEVKRKGDAAIEDWIAKQMAYTKAVVVLVGARTAGRRWVQYEIDKAWQDKRPLVGIRIHGLADSDGKTDSPGANPFAQVSTADGNTVADWVPLHTPTGADSQAVYDSIKTNIESWVDGAFAR
ncbi:MAG: TIR domain-containing protein [Micrococcales bacterium]|nr:TIR domain-containing protein [Micrococcales bacterium]MCL2668039.1 TIR domain-containing protein [Micrococcales bacterium]